MLFSVCSEVRITPHHKNGLLHLHLDWYSILPSETAETLAAARVSGVASFSATLVGPSGETRTPGILLPKQARYQLRYTRIWNCVICGLSCGLGHFLTNGFAEMVPASGSVPAGCGVAVLSSWMGVICSQSRRATPGHEVVGWSGHILPNCFIPSQIWNWKTVGIQTSSAVLDWSMCWYMQDWIFMSIPL